MMRLASESIERVPAEKRDITSVTISVSEESYTAIIEKLRALRKELLELAESDMNPEKVAQLNLQLFPVSIDFKSRRTA